MARKKGQAGESPAAESPEAPAADSPTTETPPANGNGNGGEKRRPVYTVGPIPTDRDNSVECAVWDREVSSSDGRTFTVYSVTCHASWRDGSTGQWNRTHSFRGSQIYALLYCLQKANDWILAQRDLSCPI